MRGCNNARAQTTYLFKVVSFYSTDQNRKRTKTYRENNLVTPETTDSISSDRDDPRLSRVPLGVEHTERFCHRVTLEYLERNDQRVGEEVGVDSRVENVDRSVVGSREEERVGGGEGDCSECSRVVAESLVGSGGEIEIVPN